MSLEIIERLTSRGADGTTSARPSTSPESPSLCTRPAPEQRDSALEALHTRAELAYRLKQPSPLDPTICRCNPRHVKTVSSMEAETKFGQLLADVERTGEPVTITSDGRPIAVLAPPTHRPRRFGQLPGLSVADTF